MRKTIFFLISLLFLNHFVYAQTGEPQIKPGEVVIEWVERLVSVCPPGIFGSEACDYPDVREIIQKIINFILDISPLVLVILIIVGGFIYMLSSFNVQLISKGHEYIKWAIYGYFILLIISAIFSLISVIFGGPQI